MSAVVQAMCPGCKSLLQIPAEWVHQPIRCKNCGMIMQARMPAAPVAQLVPPPPRTPAPPVPPPPPPKHRHTPPPVHLPPPPPRPAPAVPSGRHRIPVPPPPPPRSVIPPPVAPLPRHAHRVAAPAAVPPAHSNGEPFYAIDDDVSTAPRRRRRSSGGWTGPLVFLMILGGVGVAAALNWDRIKGAIAKESQTVPPHESRGPIASRQSDDSTKIPTQPKTTPRPKKSEMNPAMEDPDDPSATMKDPPRRPRNEPRNPKVPTDNPRRPRNPRNPRGPKRPSDKPQSEDSRTYPRRALLISVHNYLYANPIHDGLYLDRSKVHNLKKLVDDVLPRHLHIPNSQIVHLTDSIDAAHPRPPIRDVIEKTITKFLGDSRPQDRILVFFIGHAVEVGDEAYLVPLEGELDNASTLIPLKWLYAQLDKCKARQKILILDTNRFSFTAGLERPNGGPMGEKFDALLRAPPLGVQVWSACVAKQQSYETDESPMGAFVDEFYTALDTNALKGKHFDDPKRSIPVDLLFPIVQAALKKQSDQMNVAQTSRLTGQEKEGGAAYDAKAPMPPMALTCIPPVIRNEENAEVVAGVLKEIGVPTVKPGESDTSMRFDLLPPFPEKTLAKFAEKKGGGSPKLRKAIQHARAVLWALHPNAGSNGPPELQADIKKYKAEMKKDLRVLQEGYRAPAGGKAEKVFKDQLRQDEEDVARMFLGLGDVLEELEGVKEERGNESKRWQANYDFMLARVQAQIAFLYEYQSALGAMRKEFPKRGDNQNGWRLAASTRLTGDSAGRKLGRASDKLIKKMIKDYAGTPWEILAKREKLTALGLEWKAGRVN